MAMRAGQVKRGRTVEPVYAFGASGALVERLQTALSQVPVTWPDGHTASALDPKKIDGTFGRATRVAVRLVQHEHKLAQTGTVDAALWRVVAGDAWPEEYARGLNLLASFEGHGYTKATGNWDGAGITWGIIGFTLVSGRKHPAPNTLVTLLDNIIQAYPDDVTNAFGQDRATELKTVLPGSGDDLLAFANRITQLPVTKRVLLPEWQAGFETLGNFPDVRNLQDQLAKSLYYDKAFRDAAEFGSQFAMDCEQTRQLFFDIHVHNGAPGDALRQKIKDALKALDKNASISEKLLKIAEILTAARHAYQSDTFERLSTIARGFGTVHKTSYRLDGWGIEVKGAQASHDLDLGMLAFEPVEVREQLTLASAAKALVNPEIAARNAGAWPQDNGTELLMRKEGDEVTVSLSYRPLLALATSNALGPDPEALNLAIATSFSRPVGILGVFGQSASFELVAPRLVTGRGPQGYAGLDVKADGALMLFRQRLVTESPDDASMDIADIRTGLASCQLILLFGSNGIETQVRQTSTGRLWRALLAPFGASPIVLGWFGGACVPSDAQGQFVSSAFLDSVRKIDQKATLTDLCANHGREIVQAWGKACYDTFAGSPQRFLWRYGPFSGFEGFSSTLASLGLSGAGAIDREGNLWNASAKYTGTGDAMEQVS
jgi:hypothetical protein